MVMLTLIGYSVSTPSVAERMPRKLTNFVVEGKRERDRRQPLRGTSNRGECD